MKTSSRPVFMSVFYPCEKWHLLLRFIKKIIREPENTDGIKTFLVFLNRHRGEGVRMVIDFDSRIPEILLKKMAARIRDFVSETNSNTSPVAMPVTQFFCNYPGNEIHYNLFNERVIRDGRLVDIQASLSHILLNYFHSNQVDEKTVFGLLARLHSSLFEGLGQTENDRKLLYEHVLTKIDASTTVGEEWKDLPFEMQKPSHIENLFHDFSDLSTEVLRDRRDIRTAYDEITATIQMHLFNIGDNIVQRAACHAMIALDLKIGVTNRN